MNEAFEKIIERLEERKSKDICNEVSCVECNKKYKADSRDTCYLSIQKLVYDKTIEIVNQVAEEYKSLTIEGESLTEKFNDGWIPCSERLPEIDDSISVSENVLATDCKGSIWTAEYHKNGKWLDDVSDIRLEVIAWQPLPEPYQPKGEK